VGIEADGIIEALTDSEVQAGAEEMDDADTGWFKRANCLSLREILESQSYDLPHGPGEFTPEDLGAVQEVAGAGRGEDIGLNLLGDNLRKAGSR